MKESILELYSLLGRVVLLVVPVGTKHPGGSGWEGITYEQTQTPSYQRRLAKLWAGLTGQDRVRRV